MQFDPKQPLDKISFPAALLSLLLSGPQLQAQSLNNWVKSNKEEFASGIKNALNNAARFRDADGSGYTWDSMGRKNLFTVCAPSSEAEVYRLEAKITGKQQNSTLTVVALYLIHEGRYGLFKDPTFDIDNDNTGYSSPSPGSSLDQKRSIL